MMDLGQCINCGELVVTPVAEADIKIGIIYDYGLKICE